MRIISKLNIYFLSCLYLACSLYRQIYFSHYLTGIFR